MLLPVKKENIINNASYGSFKYSFEASHCYKMSHPCSLSIVSSKTTGSNKVSLSVYKL